MQHIRTPFSFLIVVFVSFLLFRSSKVKKKNSRTYIFILIFNMSMCVHANV